MAKKKTQAAKTATRATKKSTTKTTAAKSSKKKTSTKKAGANPAPTVEPKIVVNHDAIAREAYYLWLKRGGDPQHNWLEAESRLRRATGRSKV